MDKKTRNHRPNLFSQMMPRQCREEVEKAAKILAR